MVGMGVFLDFYIWEMNPEVVFVDSTSLDGDRTSFRYLIDSEGYTLHKILHYSFGIHLAGTAGMEGAGESKRLEGSERL